MSLLDALLARRLDLPPAVTRDITVARDLPVPMRDGVVLRADHFAPAGVERAPLVLLRTPYGRGGVVERVMGWGPLAAQRGLQVVVVSTRGTSGSGGAFDPFAEREDGLDTVAWLRSQPWYPGRFATAGPSYLGFTQWALADAVPGELVAMVPMVTAASFAHFHYPGGVLKLHEPLRWTALMAAAGPGGMSAWRALLAGPRVRRALRGGPVQELDVAATGRARHWWRSWVTSTDPDADDYWVRRDQRRLVTATDADVLLIGGWHDILLPWQLEDHAALVAAGRRPRLIIGPWNHTQGSMRIGEALRFLRARLAGGGSGVAGPDRGGGPGGARAGAGRPDGGGGPGGARDGAAGAAADAPVRLYVTGADRWHATDAWPPAQARPTRWHLAPGGQLSTAPAAAVGRSSRFTYDPADPTPSVGGPQLQGPARVRQDALLRRDDVLAFTGPVLGAPVAVMGPVTATVHLRCSTAHAQLFVRVCDVDARGRTWHLCDGIERVDDRRWPADADGVRRVQVRLWPTAHRFVAGHRIAALVAGGAHPRYVRAYGLGDPVATARRGVRAHHEVLHDAVHPSGVDLPVVAG